MPRSNKTTPAKKRQKTMKKNTDLATVGKPSLKAYNPRGIILELIGSVGDADFRERFGDQAFSDVRDFMRARHSGKVPQTASQLVRDAFAAIQSPD